MITWKVYGPDLNGRFGGLQGTGGLEAVILDADGTTTGVINDQFGNGVATVTGTGAGATVTWNTTRVGAYGPLPGIQAQTLTDISQVAAATAWRSRRMDPTGFYWLGARYYEPTSGRFLSADPMGHAASPSLYDYAGGDPVNRFDPTGRIFGTSLSTGEFFGSVGSAVTSTIGQTFASAGQTIQAGFAQTAGLVYGSDAGSAVAAQYFNQAMNNSVSGQTLAAGGSLAQAEVATGILGATLAAEGALVGGTALFSTGGETSIFYGGTGALADANAAAAAGEGMTIGQTTGGTITEAIFGNANSSAWKVASWFYSNATEDALVVLGEGGGEAGTILGDVELPTLVARTGLQPLLSTAAALALLGDTAVNTLYQDNNTYIQQDSTGKYTKVRP